MATYNPKQIMEKYAVKFLGWEAQIEDPNDSKKTIANPFTKEVFTKNYHLNNMLNALNEKHLREQNRQATPEYEVSG